MGVAGFLYSAITGSAILAPLAKRISKLIDERGAADPQVGTNTQAVYVRPDRTRYDS